MPRYDSATETTFKGVIDEVKDSEIFAFGKTVIVKNNAKGVLSFGGDVIGCLLTHLPRDMRTLTAALDALDGFALAHKRALTVALARQWLAADET